MDEKPVLFTLHAETVLRQRHLQREWVERVVRAPEWVDKSGDEPERRFRALPERDGRVLRVVCVETSADIRIITAFLDRDARRPA